MKNKMGNMPIPKLIITMSIPAIISMMVQALYNFIDSLFVAQIGKDALTAVSLAFPIQMVLIAAFVGLGIGINSAISRRLGEGKKEEAVLTAEHGYLIAIVLYAFVACLGIFFVDDFFQWFTDNETVLNYGVTYARIILIGSFGRILAQAGMSILQGSGEMKKPMYAQLIGAGTNIILDPIMIFGWFGLPAMGVAGAALATVIAQCLSMVYVFIVLRNGDNVIKLNLKHFKWQGRIAGKIMVVGLPAAIMQALVAVMITVLNKYISEINATGIAVLGIYFRVQSLVFMPIFGISQGMMPVVGYNFGAKQKKRVTSALKFAGILALTYMTLGMIVFQVFAENILLIFKSTDEMVTIGLVALRRISLMFPLVAINIVISTSFQGMGKAYYSLIVTIIRQILILLPLARFLGYNYGLDTMWYAFIITEVIGLIIALFFYQMVYRKTLYQWQGGTDEINILER